MLSPQLLQIKKRDLISLFIAFQQLSTIKNASVSFKYKLAKNIGACKHEVEAIQTGTNNSDQAIKDYEKEYLALVDKYGRRNQSGQLIITSRGEYLLADPARFNMEVGLLEKKNKDVLEKIEAHKNSSKDLLDEPVPLELINKFHRFKLSDFPEECTADQIEKMIDLIDEDK